MSAALEMTKGLREQGAQCPSYHSDDIAKMDDENDCNKFEQARGPNCEQSVVRTYGGQQNPSDSEQLTVPPEWLVNACGYTGKIERLRWSKVRK